MTKIFAMLNLKCLVGFIKGFALTIIIIALAVTAYLVNVTYTQNQYLLGKRDTAALIQGTPAVITSTANIIARDGKVPKPVAQMYATWIFEAGAHYKIDPMLILSVMFVESRFNYKAMSPTGPIGLLQVAYTWHKEKTTRAALFDPKTNILVGTQILREYQNLSRSETEMLLRYNGSLMQSTNYAVKVLSHRNRFEKEVMTAVAKEKI